MTVKTSRGLIEIRSENASETEVLLRLGLKEYSARSSGILPDDNRMLVLGCDETREFVAGLAAEVFCGSCVNDDKAQLARRILETIEGVK